MTQGFSSLARIGISAAVLAFAALIAGMGFSGTAFAASQPSSGDSGGSIKCGSGYTLNKKTNKCDKNSSSLDPDTKLYDQGRALALAGKYDQALTVFAQIKNQDDAKVLTMIGYSKRKQGDLDGGMAYYDKALAVDPNNLYTHEYLGELYVQLNNVDEAKVHLAKLETLCGTSCEQYQDLAKAIAGETDAD
jgi:tetratricopeptide (TPR) repeat protein